MSRLTEQDILTNDYTYSCSINEFEYGNGKEEIINKLGKLEDIEEQLGCPLEVLFRAIKNGIWFTNEDNELEYIDEALCFNIKKGSGKIVFDNYGYYCKNIEKIKCNEIYLEDYKKTWWLKEDKSE